jgi:hypothetical protein
MNVTELSEALQHPEIHRRILGGYRGPYALGVTDSPENSDEAAFLLRVADDASLNDLDAVEVHGESVHVIVKRGFVAPKAQRSP